jgi:predicted ArsR family transcriptional regulator
MEIMAELEANTDAMEPDLGKKIVKVLEEKGPMTRAAMVQQFQIARTTIYDALVKLIGHNVVDRMPVNNSLRGRPKVLFFLTKLGFTPVDTN